MLTSPENLWRKSALTFTQFHCVSIPIADKSRTRSKDELRYLGGGGSGALGGGGSGGSTTATGFFFFVRGRR